MEINIIDLENSSGRGCIKHKHQNIFNEKPYLHIIREAGTHLLELKDSYLTVIFNWDSEGDIKMGYIQNTTCLASKRCVLCVKNKGGNLTLKKTQDKGCFIILECDSNYQDIQTLENTFLIQKTLSHENALLTEFINNLALLNTLKGLELKADLYELIKLQWDKYTAYYNVSTLIQEEEIAEHHILKCQIVKKMLEEDLKTNISIQELASKVGTNQQYLKKHFKLLYGKTITAYKTQMRMEYSTKLLAKKDLPIWEIAQEVGYTYSSHFISVYKKYYGVSPRNSKQ